MDRTKLRADANKNSHLWAANTQRYKAGVNKRIKELLTEIDQLNEQEDILYGDKHLESYGEDIQLSSQQVQEQAKAINEKIAQLQTEKGPYSSASGQTQKPGEAIS